MSRTPDDKIRTRAYQIWEQAGRPQAEDVAHWTRAAREVEAEERAGQAVAPKRGKPAAAAAVDAPKPARARKPRAKGQVETVIPPDEDET